MRMPNQSVPYIDSNQKESSMVSMLADQVELPKMLRIQQQFPDDCIDVRDIPDVIKTEMSRLKLDNRLRNGARIAITCGSRGVANIAIVLKSIVSYVKDKGGEPFVFPAMGSHGGATAKGQQELLTEFGVTEESMGCPIISDMSVRQIAVTKEGLPVYIDENAALADGIIVVGRIKTHTAFRGPYESGLMKMMVIGMGKKTGAEAVHSYGFSVMARHIEQFGKIILKKANILCGIGLIENAYDETYRIAALLPEEIPEKEPELLALSKSLMPSLPFKKIDVLIVDQIGKEISGDGMDPNITGTFCSEYASGGISAERTVILDLTEKSHGCAIGIGVADFITKRLFDKVDLEKTYPNAIVSKMVVQAKIPMILKSDKEAVQIAIKTCINIRNRKPKIVRIKDTLHISEFEISEGLLEEARQNAQIRILSDAAPFPFDEDGQLLS